MNDYEAKQEAKRERLEARAARLRAEADRRYKAAGAIGEHIPFGQPILVGHHSEKRHRRDIDRIDRAMRASFEASKAAKELDARAAAVGTGGISSDDPEAVRKLKEQLAKCEQDQAQMKAVNAAVRKKDTATLIAKYGEGITQKLMTPDFMGRVGYPSYALSNNNANIRRIKQRIADLEKAATRETRVRSEGEGFRVVENAEANRIQILFDGKPPEDVRAMLKGYGFRWAPSEGAWQRHLNGSGAMYADIVAKKLRGE